MTNGASPTRDALDDKVNRLFAGKVVRKDLVRKVKVGANEDGRDEGDGRGLMLKQATNTRRAEERHACQSNGNAAA
jgi:hypothetical protein